MDVYDLLAAARSRHNQRELAALLGVDARTIRRWEVRETEPGACPRCGMALDPETTAATADEEGNPELQDMSKRFWIAERAPSVTASSTQRRLSGTIIRPSWRSMRSWPEIHQTAGW